MTSANDDKTTPSPNDKVVGEALKSAEARAQAAEKRAQELADAERKRNTDAEKRKRDDELKDINAAKQALAEAEKREAAALSRANALEQKEMERIDTRFQQLPEDTREALGEFKDALSTDKWARMIELEHKRMGSPPESGSPTGLPPAAPAGAGRRNHPRDGATRDLHPKSAEILDELGVDVEAARKVLEVESETESGVKRGRFVYPMKKLKNQLKERALAPTLLTDENRRKIFGL